MGKPTKPPPNRPPTARELQATIDAIEKEKPWFRSLADLRKSRTVKKVLKSDPTHQAAMILWAVRNFGALRKKIRTNYPPDFFNVHNLPGYSDHALNMVQLL